MKPNNRYNYGAAMIVSTLLVFLALGAAGCTHNRRGIEVLPLGNRNVLTLTADDVVQVMRAAGFSDAQIWEHGTALRNGLANSGAVQIKIDGTVEAVFAINGDSVYISTLGRGHFVYNVKTGWVNSGQR